MRSESIPDDDQRLTMAELRNENIGVRSESGGERPSRWLSLLTSRFSLLTWWEAVGYGALVLIGLGMRLWELGARAMHHDESLHALYSWNLFNGSEYIHNPMMHGPFQFEANAALFLVFGDSDATARLLYAIMGTVLIAMPLLFRSRLGRVGALAVSTLIFASPAILYFSRFARNDILMAVWTFGLVTCMWRYLDEGRDRYLYISAGLLALAFATKESAYLVVGTLGLWCAAVAVRSEWRGVRSESLVGRSPLSALGALASRALLVVQRALSHSSLLTPHSSFVVFLIAVTLPQWSAFSAILQDTPLLSWTGLVLAAPEGSVRIGDPVGGGNVIAFLIVIGMIGFSAYLGYRWSWSVWWRCALIFYSIWTLLYTTFLTNFYGGVKSGIWQALGYWIVQQGEGRGGQPWYYYFVTMSVYEFLPFFVGIVGIVYFLRRRDRFSAFLVYWPVTTFLLYTIASEKMPWLLVNITLPFIVVTGMFLTDAARRIDWRKAMEHSGYLLVAAVPLFIVLLWNLAFYDPTGNTAMDVAIQVALAAMSVGMVALAVYMSRSLGVGNLACISLLVVSVMLIALSVRAGAIASYRNGDVPVEMIVYTQTSPDVTRLLESIHRSARETNPDGEVRIAIDGTSGFSWPWAWYFRDDQLAGASVSFPTFGSNSFENLPSEPVVVVHSSNRVAADKGLADVYGKAERIRHRWWFPEYIYRELTPTKFVGAIFDRSAWRRAMDYWLNREGIRERIGSEDSYLYQLKAGHVTLDYVGEDRSE